MKVFACMKILRIVAAAYVPARPAKAQVDPRVASPETLLAAVRITPIRPDRIKVRAARGHACTPVLPAHRVVV
jgi:hypothetical protein